MTFAEYVDINHGHGRIERRSYYVYNGNSDIDKELWPYVQSIALVKRERSIIRRDKDGNIIDGQPSIEYQTYIMSRHMRAEELACYVRGHWKIENSLHWVLDDYFREDRCTSRIKHATENLGLLRKLLINLAKLDPNTAKMSWKAKGVYYRNNLDAVTRLLFEVIPSKY